MNKDTVLYGSKKDSAEYREIQRQRVIEGNGTYVLDQPVVSRRDRRRMATQYVAPFRRRARRLKARHSLQSEYVVFQNSFALLPEAFSRRETNKIFREEMLNQRRNQT